MNSTEEVLGELLKEASDPTTPAHRLDDIAHRLPRVDYHTGEHVLVEEVRRALMINPNLGSHTIRRFLMQKDRRMRVVENPAIPMYLLTGELDLEDFAGIIDSHLFSDMLSTPRAKLVPIVEDWIAFVVAPEADHWTGNLKTLHDGKALWPHSENIRCLIRNVFLPKLNPIQPPQALICHMTLWASVQHACKKMDVFPRIDALLGSPRAERWSSEAIMNHRSKNVRNLAQKHGAVLPLYPPTSIEELVTK